MGLPRRLLDWPMHIFTDAIPLARSVAGNVSVSLIEASNAAEFDYLIRKVTPFLLTFHERNQNHPL